MAADELDHIYNTVVLIKRNELETQRLSSTIYQEETS